jgi:FkbM family methyltransferase
MKNDLLQKLNTKVDMVALDVGARGGFSTDLGAIASITSCFGFEPDVEECSRLNESRGIISSWKSMKYLPTALADSTRTLHLNLYRQRGCSSVLVANKDLGKRFSREHYYIKDGEVKIEAKALDEVVEEHSIKSPAYMKIDVQGMEVDVFNGAQATLRDSLVGIRTEVSFLPLYNDQPLFAEVDQVLRSYGFVPMRWLELHEWRRMSKLKYPFSSKGPLPSSRGQMIHGDVLYLIQPEEIELNTEAAARRLIRLGLVSLCYGQIDHAYASFSRPIVREFLGEELLNKVLMEAQRISHQMSRGARIFSSGKMILNRAKKMALMGRSS